MFKVITMSDSNYFNAGKLFLKTRHRINADFVLYSPDLTKDQIKILKDNDIEYLYVDKNLYEQQMQYLKFTFIMDQIELDEDYRYKGFTLVDFDTFFINNWEHVFDHYFDYGLTVRNDMVKKRCLRAYTNGGVVFAKHSSFELIDYILDFINAGYDLRLSEYDEIWRPLENNRPEHKTHKRTIHRWWVDQVANSAFALYYFKRNGYHKIGSDPTFFNFSDFRIGLFGCQNYNVIDSKPDITKKDNIYIKHLKSTGRNILGLNSIREKI